MLRILDRVEEYLTAFLLACMTLLTFIQVVLRYAFDSGLIWALEATTYLFGWLVLIGISGGVRSGSHIAVDILARRLGSRGQQVLVFIAIVLCGLYAILMLYGSWTLVSQLQLFGSLAHDLPLPRWVLLFSLPLGFLLLGLRLVQVAVQVSRGQRQGLGRAAEPANVRIGGGEGRP